MTSNDIFVSLYCVLGRMEVELIVVEWLDASLLGNQT